MIFSVIIPTFQRNALLEQCLLKLAPKNQIISSNSYEVIVTDDGKLHTAEQLICDKFNWVRWVQGLGTGPASNRNNGAKYAKGDFLVFTDDDCLPDPQWLFAYDKAIRKHPEVKIFEGKTYPNTPQISLSQEAPINIKGGKLFSCNLCIEKSLFFELGGFDENFSFSYEDMEFAHRIRMLKIKYHFIQNASVCHPWRDIRSDTWKNSIRQSKGILTFIKKYPEILVHYNSLFFLKKLPTSLIKDLLPKFFRYGCKGSTVLIVYTIHCLYMALLLFIPTISVLVKNKFRSFRI